MNLLSEFRRLSRKIEQIDLESHLAEDRLGEFHQPPRLGHFSRTRMLAARRAVDDQNAKCFAGVVMATLSGQYGIARVKPVSSDFIGGIGEARPCLACHRRLS